jgi:hypothetical protein
VAVARYKEVVSNYGVFWGQIVETMELPSVRDVDARKASFAMWLPLNAFFNSIDRMVAYMAYATLAPGTLPPLSRTDLGRYADQTGTEKKEGVPWINHYLRSTSREIGDDSARAIMPDFAPYLAYIIDNLALLEDLHEPIEGSTLAIARVTAILRGLHPLVVAGVGSVLAPPLDGDPVSPWLPGVWGDVSIAIGETEAHGQEISDAAPAIRAGSGPDQLDQRLLRISLAIYQLMHTRIGKGDARWSALVERADRLVADIEVDAGRTSDPLDLRRICDLAGVGVSAYSLSAILATTEPARAQARVKQLLARAPQCNAAVRRWFALASPRCR